MAAPLDAGCYRAIVVRRLLGLSKSAFYSELRAGRLPFVVELLPRIGRQPRYKKKPIDDYLNGEYRADGARRYFKRGAA